MSEVPSTPSSVDTTGDLSRKKYNPRIRHYSQVGGPLGEPSYKAHKHRQHEGEGINSNPLKCAIVLGTVTEAGCVEYRVGRFAGLTELDLGLSEPVNPKEKNSPLRLRPEVARRCFGGSEVYFNRTEAVDAAELKYPKHMGIKVIVHACSFPPLAS